MKCVPVRAGDDPGLQTAASSLARCLQILGALLDLRLALGEADDVLMTPQWELRTPAHGSDFDPTTLRTSSTTPSGRGDTSTIHAGIDVDDHGPSGLPACAGGSIQHLTLAGW